MRWLVGALGILLVALVFDLGLLAYAMYALLTVLLVETLQRCHRLALHTLRFERTCQHRFVLKQNRTATALRLRLAPVLGGRHVQSVAEYVKQREVLIWKFNANCGAVD